MDTGLLETGKYNRTTTAEGVSVSSDDEQAALFLAVRPRLLGIAYRILRSASETEDVVQEVWLRWQRTDRSVVLDPMAFLATTTIRLALNLAQSARSRRETYTDPWFLELADSMIGPEARAEQGEEVEHAVLLLLRNLSPPERAAYVLREAFGYPYQQIADVLLLTAAHARQLVHRAHQHLAAERRRPVNPAVHRRFVVAFRDAAYGGNLTSLERLLAADLSR
jgi:RNA polymerase sigma-70 factor (ECF subfamily)